MKKQAATSSSSSSSMVDKTMEAEASIVAPSANTAAGAGSKPEPRAGPPSSQPSVTVMLNSLLSSGINKTKTSLSRSWARKQAAAFLAKVELMATSHEDEDEENDSDEVLQLENKGPGKEKNNKSNRSGASAAAAGSTKKINAANIKNKSAKLDIFQDQAVRELKRQETTSTRNSKINDLLEAFAVFFLDVCHAKSCFAEGHFPGEKNTTTTAAATGTIANFPPDEKGADLAALKTNIASAPLDRRARARPALEVQLADRQRESESNRNISKTPDINPVVVSDESLQRFVEACVQKSCSTSTGGGSSSRQHHRTSTDEAADHQEVHFLEEDADDLSISDINEEGQDPAELAGGKVAGEKVAKRRRRGNHDQNHAGQAALRLDMKTRTKKQADRARQCWILFTEELAAELLEGVQVMENLLRGEKGQLQDDEAAGQGCSSGKNCTSDHLSSSPAMLLLQKMCLLLRAFAESSPVPLWRRIAFLGLRSFLAKRLFFAAAGFGDGRKMNSGDDIDTKFLSKQQQKERRGLSGKNSHRQRLLLQQEDDDELHELLLQDENLEDEVFGSKSGHGRGSLLQNEKNKKDAPSEAEQLHQDHRDKTKKPHFSLQEPVHSTSTSCKTFLEQKVLPFYLDYACGDENVLVNLDCVDAVGDWLFQLSYEEKVFAAAARTGAAPRKKNYDKGRPASLLAGTTGTASCTSKMKLSLYCVLLQALLDTKNSEVRRRALEVFLQKRTITSAVAASATIEATRNINAKNALSSSSSSNEVDPLFCSTSSSSPSIVSLDFVLDVLLQKDLYLVSRTDENCDTLNMIGSNKKSLNKQHHQQQSPTSSSTKVQRFLDFIHDDMQGDLWNGEKIVTNMGAGNKPKKKMKTVNNKGKKRKNLNPEEDPIAVDKNSAFSTEEFHLLYYLFSVIYHRAVDLAEEEHNRALALRIVVNLIQNGVDLFSADAKRVLCMLVFQPGGDHCSSTSTSTHSSSINGLGAEAARLVWLQIEESCSAASSSCCGGDCDEDEIMNIGVDDSGQGLHLVQKSLKEGKGKDGGQYGLHAAESFDSSSKILAASQTLNQAVSFLEAYFDAARNEASVVGELRDEEKDNDEHGQSCVDAPSAPPVQDEKYSSHFIERFVCHSEKMRHCLFHRLTMEDQKGGQGCTSTGDVSHGVDRLKRGKKLDQVLHDDLGGGLEVELELLHEDAGAAAFEDTDQEIKLNNSKKNKNSSTCDNVFEKSVVKTFDAAVSLASVVRFCLREDHQDEGTALGENADEEKSDASPTRPTLQQKWIALELLRYKNTSRRSLVDVERTEGLQHGNEFNTSWLFVHYNKDLRFFLGNFEKLMRLANVDNDQDLAEQEQHEEGSELQKLKRAASANSFGNQDGTLETENHVGDVNEQTAVLSSKSNRFASLQHRLLREQLQLSLFAVLRNSLNNLHNSLCGAGILAARAATSTSNGVGLLKQQPVISAENKELLLGEDHQDNNEQENDEHLHLSAARGQEQEALHLFGLLQKVLTNSVLDKLFQHEEGKNHGTHQPRGTAAPATLSFTSFPVLQSGAQVLAVGKAVLLAASTASEEELGGGSGSGSSLAIERKNADRLLVAQELLESSKTNSARFQQTLREVWLDCLRKFVELRAELDHVQGKDDIKMHGIFENDEDATKDINRSSKKTKNSKRGHPPVKGKKDHEKRNKIEHVVETNVSSRSNRVLLLRSLAQKVAALSTIPGIAVFQDSTLSASGGHSNKKQVEQEDHADENHDGLMLQNSELFAAVFDHFDGHSSNKNAAKIGEGAATALFRGQASCPEDDETALFVLTTLFNLYTNYASAASSGAQLLVEGMNNAQPSSEEMMKSRLDADEMSVDAQGDGGGAEQADMAAVAAAKKDGAAGFSPFGSGRASADERRNNKVNKAFLERKLLDRIAYILERCAKSVAGAATTVGEKPAAADAEDEDEEKNNSGQHQKQLQARTPPTSAQKKSLNLCSSEQTSTCCAFLGLAILLIMESSPRSRDDPGEDLLSNEIMAKAVQFFRLQFCRLRDQAFFGRAFSAGSSCRAFEGAGMSGTDDDGNEMDVEDHMDKLNNAKNTDVGASRRDSFISRSQLFPEDIINLESSDLMSDNFEAFRAKLFTEFSGNYANVSRQSFCSTSTSEESRSTAKIPALFSLFFNMVAATTQVVTGTTLSSTTLTTISSRQAEVQLNALILLIGERTHFPLGNALTRVVLQEHAKTSCVRELFFEDVGSTNSGTVIETGTGMEVDHDRNNGGQDQDANNDLHEDHYALRATSTSNTSGLPADRFLEASAAAARFLIVRAKKNLPVAEILRTFFDVAKRHYNWCVLGHGMGFSDLMGAMDGGRGTALPLSGATAGLSLPRGGLTKHSAVSSHSRSASCSNAEHYLLQKPNGGLLHTGPKKEKPELSFEDVALGKTSNMTNKSANKIRIPSIEQKLAHFRTKILNSLWLKTYCPVQIPKAEYREYYEIVKLELRNYCGRKMKRTRSKNNMMIMDKTKTSTVDSAFLGYVLEPFVARLTAQSRKSLLQKEILSKVLLSGGVVSASAAMKKEDLLFNKSLNQSTASGAHGDVMEVEHDKNVKNHNSFSLDFEFSSVLQDYVDQEMDSFVKGKKSKGNNKAASKSSTSSGEQELLVMQQLLAKATSKNGQNKDSSGGPPTSSRNKDKKNYNHLQQPPASTQDVNSMLLQSTHKRSGAQLFLAKTFLSNSLSFDEIMRNYGDTSVLFMNNSGAATSGLLTGTSSHLLSMQSGNQLLGPEDGAANTTGKSLNQSSFLNQSASARSDGRAQIIPQSMSAGRHDPRQSNKRSRTNGDENKQKDDKAARITSVDQVDAFDAPDVEMAAPHQEANEQDEDAAMDFVGDADDEVEEQQVGENHSDDDGDDEIVDEEDDLLADDVAKPPPAKKQKK
ncbi:unnamed protein product [Amoebophrya sp. A120]|nr:unnamed protein product [Amoebophrya sp. A120]|eukprot:GSA120T00015531001.1